MPISLSEAILGTKMTVDTVDGKLNINVKAGINDGDIITLKHLGMIPFHPKEGFDINSQRGDQIIKLKVVIPKTLSDK